MHIYLCMFLRAVCRVGDGLRRQGCGAIKDVERSGVHGEQMERRSQSGPWLRFWGYLGVWSSPYILFLFSFSSFFFLFLFSFFFFLFRFRFLLSFFFFLCNFPWGASGVGELLHGRGWGCGPSTFPSSLRRMRWVFVEPGCVGSLAPFDATATR